MKILTAQQMRDWDEFTMEKEKITSMQLMERAAAACVAWILKNDYGNKQMQVLCGTGNNGGDGLAIAGLLHEKGVQVTVWIADFGTNYSPDFTENLARLQELDIDTGFLKAENDFSQVEQNCIVIEALFGSGLNRPLTGLYAALVNYLNHSDAKIISVDVPAGLFTDRSSQKSLTIEACETLTFQCMKLCFLMPENATSMGNVHVLDIGLNNQYLQNTHPQFEMADLQIASSFYKKREKFSHKNTYGHALLIVGNEGKMGAAVMCATACLRAGAGLLTCSVPKEYFSILHITIPEAMMVARGNEEEWNNYAVIGIGPGVGKEPDTVFLLQKALQNTRKPMVIDADAINILSDHEDWMDYIPQGSVFTPHPKEFDRLFGKSENDFDRMTKAVKAAKEKKIIVILKGAYTLITDGERNFYNTTGNNGLATGGSGDTLTGIVTGLLAQKYKPFDAAVVAVYIHGLAADLCLGEQSYESLLPTDLMSKLGKSFQQLQKNKGA